MIRRDQFKVRDLSSRVVKEHSFLGRRRVSEEERTPPKEIETIPSQHHYGRVAQKHGLEIRSPATAIELWTFRGSFWIAQSLPPLSPLSSAHPLVKRSKHPRPAALRGPPVLRIMFYSHEILTQREYGVATIWYPVTASSRCESVLIHTKQACCDPGFEIGAQKSCTERYPVLQPS